MQCPCAGAVVHECVGAVDGLKYVVRIVCIYQTFEQLDPIVFVTRDVQTVENFAVLQLEVLVSTPAMNASGFETYIDENIAARGIHVWLPRHSVPSKM